MTRYKSTDEVTPVRSMSASSMRGTPPPTRAPASPPTSGEQCEVHRLFAEFFEMEASDE